eukprot:768254-Hanusia_phi.AAC.5
MAALRRAEKSEAGGEREEVRRRWRGGRGGVAVGGEQQPYPHDPFTPARTLSASNMDETSMALDESTITCQSSDSLHLRSLPTLSNPPLS